MNRDEAQETDTAPIRLCCMTRHVGLICPDESFMCCMCFERVPVVEVYIDGRGQRWDCCRPCGECPEHEDGTA